MTEAFGQFHEDIAGRFAEYGSVVTVVPHADIIKDEMDFEVGVIKSDVETFHPDYVDGKIEGSKAFKVIYKGDYNQLANAWGVAMMHMQAQKISENADIPSREIYVVGPGQDSIPANWITEIYIPVKE